VNFSPLVISSLLFLAFPLFASSGDSDFIFDTSIELNKSQPVDDKGVVTVMFKWASSVSHDLFNFWEITDNISETEQDRDIED